MRSVCSGWMGKADGRATGCCRCADGSILAAKDAAFLADRAVLALPLAPLAGLGAATDGAGHGTAPRGGRSAPANALAILGGSLAVYGMARWY